jgi:hypothetical protein
MGGPNPGIDANVVVEEVEDLGKEYDLVRVTMRIPRYCAINADGSLYFVKDQQYGAHFIADYPVPEEPKKT